jgi:4-oxalomesaconate hydratase
VIERLLVIGAHAADFVWRAAGVIALATSQGATATVLALSYGERGESGELWKEPGQTVERVKQIRHEQAERAARILGAEFCCFDLGDYPLDIDRAALERLTTFIRDTAPDIIVTHTPQDPFNPDHPTTHEAVMRARLLASGAGVASAFETIRPPVIYCFEPHQPDLCGFVPTVFVDITPVYEQKVAAMQQIGSQQYLQRYYAELAERRGNHARRISGRGDIRYAEAFQQITPTILRTLLSHEKEHQP